MSTALSRRSIGALLLATPALSLVTSVLAQEATPDPNLPASRVLSTFIYEVVGNGNLLMIPDLIDADREGVGDFFLIMIDIATGIREKDEGEIQIVPKMVAIEPEQAMALIDIGEGPERYAFLYFELAPETGLIRAANAAWHDY